jgi:hypothetical protein
MPAALSHCGCRAFEDTYIECNYRVPIGLPQWLREWNDGWTIIPRMASEPIGGIRYSNSSKQAGLDCSRECLADQLYVEEDLHCTSRMACKAVPGANLSRLLARSACMTCLHDLLA